MSESTFDRLTKSLPPPADVQKKRRMLLGALAVAGAGLVGLGAGFGTGGISLPDTAPPPPVATTPFHALPDLMVNLRPTASVKLMKIGITLKAPPERVAELAALEPVLVDGLQDYLRHLDEHDLEGRAGLDAVRSEILRRMRLLAKPVPVDEVLLRTLILQ